MWQRELSRLVDEEFQGHKRQDPKFSIRAYAKKLGLSPGSLSDLMLERTTWNITPKRASEILNKLALKASVKNRLLVQMGLIPEHTTKDLASPDYEILTDWVYSPILASFDLPPEQRSIGRIAAQLGLDEGKVTAVVEDLLKRGLLIKTETGVERPEEFVRTSDGVPSEVIRRYHEVNLELSARALRELPVEKRDFTSLTFTGSQKKLEYLRDEIRKLYEKASALVDEEAANTDVFRLSIQLFPFEFRKQ